MVSAGPCWSAKPGMFDVSAPTAGRAHFGLRHCFGERRHVTSPSRRATDRAGEGVSTSSRKSPSTCSASTARPDSWRMRRCTSSPTEFLRSDELPGDAAIGYLAVDRPRTNVFHLPVLGSRDGGIYTTVADVHALWGGAGRRSHRADGPGGADAATTQRGSDRIKTESKQNQSGTGWGSGWMPPARRRCWKGWTPGCRSTPGTTPVQDSPGQWCPTRPTVPGRSCGISESCCDGDCDAPAISPDAPRAARVPAEQRPSRPARA